MKSLVIKESVIKASVVIVGIICIVIFLIALLKGRKERTKVFEKEELEYLHHKNIVGENNWYELYLYHKIRDKYTEVIINIPLEKQKVREKLGVYTNEISNQYLTTVFLVFGALFGALFGGIIDVEFGWVIIVAYTVIFVAITTIKFFKPMRRNKVKIKYYSMCLSVLEELELEKLNINKNEEV